MLIELTKKAIDSRIKQAETNRSELIRLLEQAKDTGVYNPKDNFHILLNLTWEITRDANKIVEIYEQLTGTETEQSFTRSNVKNLLIDINGNFAIGGLNMYNSIISYYDIETGYIEDIEPVRMLTNLGYKISNVADVMAKVLGGNQDPTKFYIELGKDQDRVKRESEAKQAEYTKALKKMFNKRQKLLFETREQFVTWLANAYKSEDDSALTIEELRFIKLSREAFKNDTLNDFWDFMNKYNETENV